jgi:hypothetical protein
LARINADTAKPLVILPINRKRPAIPFLNPTV